MNSLPPSPTTRWPSSKRSASNAPPVFPRSFILLRPPSSAILLTSSLALSSPRAPRASCAPDAPRVMQFQNIVLKLSREGEERPHPRERKRMQTTPARPEPAAAETTRRTPLCPRRRRDEGVLPNYRRAVVPAAERLYGQTTRSFPAKSRQPVAFVAFRQHARHETLINSILSTAPVQSHGLIYSRSHALPVAAPSCWRSNSSFLRLRSFFPKDAIAQHSIAKVPIPVFSHPFASPRQGCASPGKATQASREKTSASLACKASFLRPMATPQPFVRKALALLRFVARNCALSLIIARYGGIPLKRFFSRELTRWHSTPSGCPHPELTQMNPGLAQIFLSYGANFLSQSGRIRPNLSQRLFRQSFQPNLTYGPLRVDPFGPGACFKNRMAPVFAKQPKLALGQTARCTNSVP
ncbi:MAG: hypothetical protein JWM16_357 [Verrucomicrobiales bacterium]|nr:hypothetical protein [Verrucomicrobiales bacterium]